MFEAEIRSNDLLPDERIAWTGRPKPGFSFVPGEFAKSCFGCIYGGFALFWMIMAGGVALFGSNAGGQRPTDIVSVLFPLFGLPFFLIGLWLAIGTAVTRTLRRKRTAYAITNRRLITVRGGNNRQVETINLERIEETSMSEYTDHSGSISLTLSNRDLDRLYRRQGNRSFTPPSIECVPDVQSAYHALEAARAACKPAGPLDP